MFGVLGMTSPTQAAIIDFNSLTGSGLVNRGLQYQEDGFQLDNLSLSQFTSIHSGDSRYTGTPSFFNNGSNGVTRLTQIGGGAFTLSSIDLDSFFTVPPVSSVTFTATLLGGGTTSQTFTTDSIFASLQTFIFGSAFANVTQVEWTNGPTSHSFDNIVVSAVPVPGAVWLMGSSLLGLVGLARRKSSNP
jgi:hypothetical protein